jgi:Ca2+-binding EF-hand superfamily protein
MINNISSSQYLSAQARPNMFSKIDANSDNSVSKEEFIAARPKNVSESKATELFSKLDTEGTGNISQTQFDEGMEKNKPQNDSATLQNMLGSAILSALMQLGQQSSSANTGSEDKFSQIDTDGNGAVSKEEFVNNRPENVTEEMASNLFASLDTEGTGSISQSQLESGMESAKGPKNSGGPPPAGGPPPSGGAGKASGTENEESSSGTNNYDELDTNQDGKVSASELLAGLSSAQENSTDSETKAILSAISNAINSYAQNNSINLDQTILFDEAA